MTKNTIDDLLLAAARKKEYETIMFKRMMGHQCITDINTHIYNALHDPRNIENIHDEVYFAKVIIRDLDITNMRKHLRESFYFQRSYMYDNGIPIAILKECIQLPNDLSVIRLETQFMSDMYINTFADTCCDTEGFITNILCCCIPFLFCTRCNTKTLKPNHIDMQLRIWFKKNNIVIGEPVTFDTP